MQSWDSVKVTDQSLEAFGRVGSVRSAGVYKGEPDKKGHTVELVNVQLDGDDAATIFHAAQVTAL